MATGTYTQQDPFESAMNPSQPNQDRTYFGLVTIVDAYHCVLEKGVGKRLFDPTRDDINQRSTAITVSVEVAKRDGGVYTLDQNVTDWSKEWKDYTLPSLRQLGADLRTLKGRYAQVKRQSTGETYTNKSGEVKDKSALVFLAFYPDAEAMQAAAEAFYTSRKTETPAPVPGPVADPTDSGERAFALDTLNALWKFCNQDEDKFLAALQQNPMVMKHFPPDSKEVQNLVLGF